MNITQKNVLHNEFLIEVVDANTNKVKEQYKAYNIILDQFFTRTIDFSSCLSSIQYGTGTGNLDRTRNSLFAFLGGKNASLIDSRYSVDKNETWVQKRIQIMPEEHVGSTITEVGVGYNALNGGSLCTHAFVLDSQGNPVGIEKSETDVINIYATVYLTYETSHPNISICNNNVTYSYDNSASSNPFTQLILNQSNQGFGSLQWHLGDGKRESSKGESSIEKSFASSGSGSYLTTSTWTKDSLNKTLTSKKYRFDINSGNGNIYEIGLGGFMRARLPIPGIWEGYHFKNKSLGVGDGIKKEFIITSVENPRPGSVIVKSNDVIKSEGYTQENYFNGIPRHIVTRWEQYSNYGVYNSYGLLHSKDRKNIFQSYTDSMVKKFSLSDAGAILETFKDGEVMNVFQYADITEDKRFIVSSFGGAGEMFYYLYRSANLEKMSYKSIGTSIGINDLEEGEVKTIASSQGVAFSKDGDLMFISLTTTINSTLKPGRLFKYDQKEDIYRKVSIDYNGFSLPLGNYLMTIRTTIDNKYFIVTTSDIKTGNNLMLFEIGENTIKAVEKNLLFDELPPIDSMLRHLKISDDGSILVVHSNLEKLFYIYNLVNGRYVLKQKLETGFSISDDRERGAIDISPNNEYILFSYLRAGYLLKRNKDGSFEFANNKNKLSSSSSDQSLFTGFCFSGNSKNLMISSYNRNGSSSDYYSTSNEYSIVENEAKILFDEPPAEGEVLTFDCDVDYIPKDTNSVLDLQVTIQFSDANENN